MAGYSVTPLAKKLGFKAGLSIFLANAPDNYAKLVTPSPAAVHFVVRATRKTDLLHVFARSCRKLRQSLPRLRKAIAPATAIRVYWQKKSSRLAGDITEDAIRQIASPLGRADVKACAGDEAWSGLKRVVRRELR